MAVVPCSKNEELERQIHEYSEILKTQAHALGNHGLSEDEFYQSGLFRGAIERVRGQFSADRAEKRDFVRRVLNYLQDNHHIINYEETDKTARHDFRVETTKGNFSAIAVKGCLDGNNTNVFERPLGVREFIIWSICTNPGADPRRNVWSGIHTRLSAEIIERKQQVDGVVVWDWQCGTVARPCPKASARGDECLTTIGPWRLVPPCIYLMPNDVPGDLNSSPAIHKIDELPLLFALHTAFHGKPSEVSSVQIVFDGSSDPACRSTIVTRSGKVQQASTHSPLKRR